MRILKFQYQEDWIRGVVKYILDCADFAIKERDSFHIVLSGGQTPQLIYHKLAEVKTNWEKWHFWIGDERFPFETYTQLNKSMIQHLLLDKIPYIPQQVHFMHVELGLDGAVRDYSDALKAVNIFDLALLGIGEDGHTASLFPCNNIGIADTAEDILSITNAPKAPPNRLSLSAKRLSATRNVLFIVKGVEKKNIIEKVQLDNTLPCNKIVGAHESYLYYCSN